MSRTGNASTSKSEISKSVRVIVSAAVCRFNEEHMSERHVLVTETQNKAEKWRSSSTDHVNRHKDTGSFHVWFISHEMEA